MKNKHVGSNFEDFLKEEGIHEEVSAAALKRALALDLLDQMKRRHISKSALAKRMRTSRSQVDRLLDPHNGSATLETLSRAAAVVGKRLRVELV